MEVNTNIVLQKRTYCPPYIGRILLDNEISLQLQSGFAPDDPENYSKTPEYFNSDPFNSNVI